MVNLWAVWLTASPEVRRSYHSLLSEDERVRADRFAFDRHREAYELSQGALRLLLGKYLRCAAQDVEFTLGENGKPALRGDVGLGFNKSHSKGLALYGFADGCDVGVDVEADREVPQSEGIAARYFRGDEFAEPFLRVWTRKEAYVKGAGGGLTLLGNGQVPEDWMVQEADPAPGFLGAVAYRGQRREVRFHGVLGCQDLL
jgi:4'-phosphopantetheinyl transferase